jgi:predicted SAM-dependent methyltransferase
MKKLIKNIINLCLQKWSLFRFDQRGINKIHLCCGTPPPPNYIGIDFRGKVDLRLNMEKGTLLFNNVVLDVVTCSSAINCFTRHRGQEIINEIYRELKPSGITRFSVQDLESIAQL